MKSFNYTIKDPLGIHARPAGMLVKTVKATDSHVTIQKGDQKVSADRLLSVMGLGIRCGDTVNFTVTDGDEEATVNALLSFLQENL